MEEIREMDEDPIYNPDDIMYDVSADAERYRKRLTTKEFASHLDECNYGFRDEVMDKVFLLKVNGTIFEIP
jgi:hypothetical protein